jgi:hypothetical protein
MTDQSPHSSELQESFLISEEKHKDRKERCLQIAKDSLEGIFKQHYIDPERDSAATKITQLLANWIESYAQEASNREFYQNIVRQTGEIFGPESKISDDGSVQEDVLALKVPELAEKYVKLFDHLKAVILEPAIKTTVVYQTNNICQSDEIFVGNRNHNKEI